MLSRASLGPVATIDGKELAAEAVHLLRELGAGLAHLRARVTLFHALGVMSATRLLYGLLSVASILISRDVLSSDGNALASFTMVLAFAAAGLGLQR